MSTVQVEKRLAALEAKVEQLSQKVEGSTKESAWWRQILGSFAGDKDHEIAMKLGRQYRQSLRPKGPRRNGRTRH